MSSDSEEFPQLAAMMRVQSSSQVIGEFLDWLSQNGMTVCERSEGLRGTQFVPVRENADALLARYWGIDLVALECERRAVLEQARLRQSSPN